MKIERNGKIPGSPDFFHVLDFRAAINKFCHFLWTDALRTVYAFAKVVCQHSNIEILRKWKVSKQFNTRTYAGTYRWAR